MHTLGYRFRPWTQAKAIADGPAILRYIRDTAAEAGIDRRIRDGPPVVRAEWSTVDARWTVQAGHQGGSRRPPPNLLDLRARHYPFHTEYEPRQPGNARVRGTGLPPLY